MESKTTRVLVAVAVAGMAVLVSVWWLGGRGVATLATSPPSVAVTRPPLAPRPPMPSIRPVEVTEVDPAPTDRPPAPAATLAALFPDQTAHRCPAPSGIPEGRLTVGSEATALIRGGETWVITKSPRGRDAARAFGRVVGEVAWGEGRCAWSEPERVVLSGRVVGDESYAVAGCPVGAILPTDPEGRFMVEVPVGQACAARAIDLDGETLAMGKPFQFDAEDDANVVLEAPRRLSDAEIAQARDLLIRMGDARLDRLHDELDRWTAAQDGGDAAKWMLSLVERDLDFFESERASLDDPEQSLEVIADFLSGASN